MELEPEVSTAIPVTKLCCVLAKNTTQSELPRVLRQLDEYRNIYSLHYHESLWSSRTYVTLNSVLSTSQHKRVQERSGQTVNLSFVLYFGATHPIFGRVGNESSCARTITKCNKSKLILQIKRIT